MKLDKSSLILNVGVMAGVPIKPTVTGLPEDVAYDFGYFIRGDNYLTDENEAGKYIILGLNGADGLALMPDFFNIDDSRNPESPNYDPDFDFDAFLNDTYTLYVGVQSPEDADEKWALDQDKWAKVRFTLTQDEPKITSLKASGTIDLNNDDSRVTFTPTYSGKQSSAYAMVEVTDANGFPYYFDNYMDGEKVLIGRAAGEEFLKPGTYTATFKVFWGLGSVEKTTTFKVVEKKPTLKVTGKLDSGKEDSALYVTSSYKHSIGDGLMQTPEVALLSGGVPVDENLYNVEFEESGRIKITPNVFGKELLKAGRYTLQLTFGDKELVQTANITVSQTAPTLKLSKTSVTLHPEFDTRKVENEDGEVIGYENAVFIFNSYTGVSHDAKYEFYQANGKTEWDDQPYVSVEEFSANGYIVLGPTGKAPDKDTTVKIKVTPDSRIPNKFGWVTVKVLGGKSLTKKLTLKASNALDPSCSYTDATFTTKVSGFDNKNITGEVVLQQYVSGKWQDVENGSDEEPRNQFYNGWAYGDNAYISMHDVYEEGERTQYLDPNGKYRMVVTYSDNVSATVDLKVAYGKNKFTVAQAPTLYKQDYKAGVSFYIDQQDAGQQIAKVEIKNQAKTGFTLESNDHTLYGKNNWTLKYNGDPAKLKTTTLSLQIFLKGNETTKPNATMSLKVTVK